MSAPARRDPVVAAASEVVGGPRGRYAARRSLPWVVVAAALSGLAALPVGVGLVLRVPCIRSGWVGTQQFWNACYTDLAPAYRDGGIRGGLAAYLQGAPGAPSTGQPPLTGLLLRAVASLVPDQAALPPALQEAASTKWFFAIWAVLLVVALLVTISLVAASTRRPLTAAHVALSPVVALTLLLSADLVGVTAATAGMVAWGRRRRTLAGVLLGLGISARSYPVLILLAIGLLALRAGRLGEFGRTAGYAGLTFGAVLSAVTLLNPTAAVSAYQAWLGAGAGYGSPWLLPQLGGRPLPAGAVTVLAVGGWLLALALGAVLALAARRRPTVAEVSLVMVGTVLMTGKSFTVQSSLWLVPLVALCALQWRDHLLWAGAEALNFVAVWLVIAASAVPDRGLPNSWYAVFSMLRVVAVGWLVLAAWLQARRRLPEGVEGVEGEEGEEADELAGALTHAPDRLRLRFS